MRKWPQKMIGVLLILVLVTASLPGRAGASTSGATELYPVIFLPGIAGTELYNGRELVWINVARLLVSHIPLFNLFQLNWLMPLRLADDGQTPFRSDYQIRVGDVMRGGLTDAYSGLIGALKQQGYTEGKNLRLFPYDWRQDPTEAADRLGALVDRTLKETGAEQVILICHSLGGLIARDYVVRGGAPKVRATISLATPWLGAPVTYRALAYGWDFGIRIPGTRWSVLAPADVKRLVRNYPSVYMLAPGSAYFDRVPEGYISRDGKPLSFEQTLDQGLGAHNRMLAMQAPAYQDRLLDGSDHGVMQFILAGTGRPTIAGFTERRDWLGFTQMTERYADGDDVVPLISADLGLSQDPKAAEPYLGNVLSVGYIDAPHILFAQAPGVQAVVTAWIDVIHGRRAPGFETVWAPAP